MPDQESDLRHQTLAHAIADMATLARSPARAVTGVRILRDGADAFPAMIDLIGRARHSVLFENFIFAGDATGRMFADTLAAAARRGVEVRVIYDPLGTLLVDGGSVARLLCETCGVQVRPFRPLSPFQPWTWWRFRHRDHRKTLSVDGETAVVGGFCISDNWASAARGGKDWRDTGLLVQGGVVADVEDAFEAMWWRADLKWRRHAIGVAEECGLPAALIAADQPGGRHVSALYHWLAEQAQRTLEITDAYLVTPKHIQYALAAAARRGVRVRLLLPGRNNHPVAGAAARHVYAPLLDAGVEIWEWDGVMLHAKTAVVDGEVTLVGSSNLDPLSMRRNYELNLVVADPATGSAMCAMFARDLENATRIDPAAWARRPRWQRALQAVASLFGANL